MIVGIDLITCFKILHGLISLSSGDFFSIVSNRSTRGNSYKLFLPDSRVDSRKHFFAIRVVHVWNSLPDEVVCSGNLTIFIRKLKQHSLKVFNWFCIDVFLC